jgi:hypothetical protein
MRHYTDRMPADVGSLEFKSAVDGGLDNIYFAFTGEAQKGKGHTYRVQGPTFVSEYLNQQADSAGNPANHIHSVWRDLRGDFAVSAK